jgi:hypothetical protein
MGPAKPAPTPPDAVSEAGQEAAAGALRGDRWCTIDRVQLTIPGSLRCHTDDPFGNRIELIDAGGRSS